MKLPLNAPQSAETTEDPCGTDPPVQPTIPQELETIGQSLLGLLKIEGLRLRVRFQQKMLGLVLGFLGGIIALVLLVMATRYLMIGIAGALGELFGDRPWAGMLASGALVLSALFFGLKTWRSRNSRRKVAALERSLGHTAEMDTHDARK